MSKKLWGGRFKKETDKDFFEFQKSIQYDYKLAKYDINHSLLHVLALQDAGILTKEEGKEIDRALREILDEINTGKFMFSENSEDIHTEIQNKVEKKIGRLSDKLHTLRSRNDQVVFDEKYYCKVESGDVASLLSEVLISLNYLSNKYGNLCIPGYTHTQRAQVINFKDYLGAFVSMFIRDKERLSNFKKSLIIYIGSGAFKGTSLTKNYDKAIRLLAETMEVRKFKNAPDNVSDRDFIIEFLNILSIIQMHLSRLACDFILFSTKEFGYFGLPEEFCTGSSLMPHKKNPDFLELIRGYTGRIYGNLISVLTTMKSIPLTYNRDMQLDKEPLFSSVEIIKDELKILAKFIKGVGLNKEVIAEAIKDESLYAVDLTEYLVKKKISFKEAHETVGKLIRYSEDNNCKIKDMDDKQLSRFSPLLSKEVIRKTFKGIKYA